MKKTLIVSALPTAFCHASTIAVCRNGDLLCCWFGGTHEGREDVAIYSSRRSNEQWSEPEKIADGVAANWNPVLFRRDDGVLQLFFKEGQEISSWRTKVMLSVDDGRTWSEPQELVSGDCSGGRGGAQ